jgi:flagellar operon protein
MSQGAFIYPNVTTVPGQIGADTTDRAVRKRDGVQGEFDQVIEEKLKVFGNSNDLNQVKNPLKFSAHASQRLRDRKISLDPATMAKVSEAVDKADSKGVEEALILTANSALIVNVRNRTVITAVDRDAVAGNVFTNIDGAVLV